MRAMRFRRGGGGGDGAAADAEAEALLRGLDEMESQARLGKDSLGFTVELLTAQEELETKVRLLCLTVRNPLTALQPSRCGRVGV